MSTQKQQQAALKNIKKAQKTWENMSSRQRALTQPQGRSRKKPGSGGGEYYHIEVRPKSQFQRFRSQDIGREGHTIRVAGQRGSGSWDTQKWLVNKDDAHVSPNGRLVFDDKKTEEAIKKATRGPILHQDADRFVSKPRENVPEKDKPTEAQKKARAKNIKKAQAAR